MKTIFNNFKNAINENKLFYDSWQIVIFITILFLLTLTLTL